MTPSLEKMAWMPEGSKMLNPEGTCCGFSLLEESIQLYFLPGVPDQMRYLVDKVVLPELLSLYDTLPVMRQRVLKIYGLNEPRIAEIFKDIREKTGDVVLGFYPHFPENHVTMSHRSKDEHSIMKELDRVEEEIRVLFGPFIFASGNESMEDVVGARLSEEDLTVSVAESCTGGLVGHRLTNVAGSSSYFQGGVIVYTNQSKRQLLSVSHRTLETYGAVSDHTVREMAVGVRKRFNSDIGLAITGIAGPDGGRPEKPVGTVHIGLASLDEVISKRYHFWGNREQVKLNSSTMALDWARRFVNGDPFLSRI
jgi:nicotinamide-nucleotide amidase